MTLLDEVLERAKAISDAGAAIVAHTELTADAPALAVADAVASIVVEVAGATINGSNPDDLLFDPARNSHHATLVAGLEIMTCKLETADMIARAVYMGIVAANA